MRRFVFLLSLVFLQFSGTPAQADLVSLWNAEMAQPGILKENIGNKLGDRRIFFVGGLAQEFSSFLSWYFPEALAEVKSLNLKTSYHGHWTSLYPAPDNVDHLFREIMTQYSLDQRKMMLVGHSKGGQEILFLLLKHPELMLLGVVDLTILIQAPIQGSPAAEFANMSYPSRLFSTPMGQGISLLQRQGARAALETSYEAFLKSLEHFFKANPPQASEARDWISSRIFYARSSRRHTPISMGLRMIHLVNWGAYDHLGPNDGLILEEDQTSSLIGQDLGSVDADHLALVLGGRLSMGTPESRRAYFRALLARIIEDLGDQFNAPLPWTWNFSRL